ncbi:MAG: hypothetical protein HN846_00705 [Candidatus Pacebacteria bacterium]|jgi:hypothetical protein|nr:hypothetical protein [Candidatus Paceibacterota bacterium]MBT3511476.1 hypothetical protein [Candidatus Paceibacterota bacterium]MBT4004671.1 hypothetical protein [Candidatus Paceibacterota bacterium]MBT4358411.1 hypothetical protein [Candidatus Paceibacterota bacterium]MBT4680846.1 hypothetical protein [Candidatus Paceibacterota bacterium]
MQQKVFFYNSNGGKLVGILENPTDNINVPMMLLVHGFASDKSSQKFAQVLSNGKLHTIKGGLHHLRRNPQHSLEVNKVISEFISARMTPACIFLLLFQFTMKLQLLKKFWLV